MTRRTWITLILLAAPACSTEGGDLGDVEGAAAAVVTICRPGHVSRKCVTCTGTCGDTSGVNATDKPCCCGDLVATNTVLGAGDPVTVYQCAADGLAVGPGISLDLGGHTVAGGGEGSGISLPAGAWLANGTVSGFATGVRITSEVAGPPEASVTGLVVEYNTGDGISVDVRDAQRRVTLQSLTVRGNGDDGVQVRGAPGAVRLDDLTYRGSPSDYGVVMPFGTTLVTGNGGAGIHLGDPAQAGNVAAYVEGIEVSDNGTAGVLLEQKSGLAPGASCAGSPGCSGATLSSIHIHANLGAGVELRSGNIVPTAAGSELGFRGNQVSSNAMPVGSCSGPQGAPQILVSGPVGLSGATCASAATQSACAGLSSSHCVWNGTQCKVAWDLRGGGVFCDANLNRVYNYALGPTAPLKGLRATNGAVVRATFNSWRSSTETVSFDASSFVDASNVCSPITCAP